MGHVTGLGTFYSPFFLSFGPGLGYAFGYDLYGSGFSPYPYPLDDFGDDGSLRLQVEPKDAQVFVDGYYAGVVDDFDGHFQHLNLTPGVHHVEIRAEGYRPLVFDTAIAAHHKTTYRGVLALSER